MNPINDEKLKIWKNLIEEKKQSSLTVKDFCKEKNITPAQFYYYHAMINYPKKTNVICKKEEPTLKPIHLVGSSSREVMGIQIILPNNLQCVLPRDISPSEIKTLLQALLSC